MPGKGINIFELLEVKGVWERQTEAQVYEEEAGSMLPS